MTIEARCQASGFEDGERGQEPVHVGETGMGEGKRRDSLLQPPEGASLAGTLTSNE